MRGNALKYGGDRGGMGMGEEWEEEDGRSMASICGLLHACVLSIGHLPVHELQKAGKPLLNAEILNPYFVS
eukprot:762413-Hanusia_phi.AAC.6